MVAHHLFRRLFVVLTALFLVCGAASAAETPAEIEAKIEGFPSWLEIDLDALGANLEQIRKRTGAGMQSVSGVEQYDAPNLLPGRKCNYRKRDDKSGSHDKGHCLGALFIGYFSPGHGKHSSGSYPQHGKDYHLRAADAEVISCECHDKYVELTRGKQHDEKEDRDTIIGISQDGAHQQTNSFQETVKSVSHSSL